MPGGDVNPYLAIAGMVAGALHGIENELELEDAFAGNAYDDADARRGCRRRCATRWRLWESARRRPARVRRRGRRPLRQQRAGSSWPPSTPR